MTIRKACTDVAVHSVHDSDRDRNKREGIEKLSRHEAMSLPRISALPPPLPSNSSSVRVRVRAMGI